MPQKLCFLMMAEYNAGLQLEVIGTEYVATVAVNTGTPKEWQKYATIFCLSGGGLCNIGFVSIV